ncbi:MAG TPA: NHLP-related RiPP peptide [Usitatibacter sp.]|nr:NHLP-related RiPP peptide [Usitatibacter sp.]
MFDACSEEATHDAVSTTRSACLPDSVIRALLDRLAEDDGFRARFEADPRAALIEVGYETPTAQRGVPGADPVLAFDYFHGGLASKAKIAAGRELWLKQLRDGEQIFGPFSICA